VPDLELPAGDVVENAPEAVPEETPAEVPEEIEIGERTFKTQAEALAFARAELQRKEQESAVAEAYRAGIADLSAHQAPAAAPAEDNWEEKFYANPKGTLEELREQIKQEVLGQVTTQTEDQKLWSEFQTKHPDLVGFEDDVKVTLAKFDKEIKGIAATKGKEKAMEFLAQKTRVKFQEYIDRAKPQHALSNTRTAGASTSQTSVTPKIVVEKVLSFAEQVKQNRAKRMS